MCLTQTGLVRGLALLSRMWRQGQSLFPVCSLVRFSAIAVLAKHLAVLFVCFAALQQSHRHHELGQQAGVLDPGGGHGVRDPSSEGAPSGRGAFRSFPKLTDDQVSELRRERTADVRIRDLWRNMECESRVLSPSRESIDALPTGERLIRTVAGFRPLH